MTRRRTVYFWQNDTINPPNGSIGTKASRQNFGDYGLDWNTIMTRNIWYIEVLMENGILAEKYDTTKLWHFSTSR